MSETYEKCPFCGSPFICNEDSMPGQIVFSCGTRKWITDKNWLTGIECDYLVEKKDGRRYRFLRSKWPELETFVSSEIIDYVDMDAEIDRMIETEKFEQD